MSVLDDIRLSGNINKDAARQYFDVTDKHNTKTALFISVYNALMLMCNLKFVPLNKGGMISAQTMASLAREADSEVEKMDRRFGLRQMRLITEIFVFSSSFGLLASSYCASGILSFLCIVLVIVYVATSEMIGISVTHISTTHDIFLKSVSRTEEFAYLCLQEPQITSIPNEKNTYGSRGLDGKSICGFDGVPGIDGSGVCGPPGPCGP